MEKEKVEEEIKNREFNSIIEEFERIFHSLLLYNLLQLYLITLYTSNPSLSIEDFKSRIVRKEDRYLVEKFRGRFDLVRWWHDVFGG